MNLIDKDKIVSDLQKVLGITDEQIEKGGINADIIDSANPLIGGFLQYILNLPTIDAVEVKHGEWMEEGSSCSYIFHCSVCGGVAYFVHGKGRGRNMERRFCGYRYCPNCGAKMQTVTDCHTLEEGER